MNCPECGTAGLINGTHDVEYIYKGHTTFISVTGDKCPQCGEVILDVAGSDMLEKGMDVFQNTVNKSLVDTGKIVTIRKKLGLGQKEAEHLFGLGPNAFSRYELGKTTPPQTLLILLDLLNERPELLADVQRWSSAAKPTLAMGQI